MNLIAFSASMKALKEMKSTESTETDIMFTRASELGKHLRNRFKGHIRSDMESAESSAVAVNRHLLQSNPMARNVTLNDIPR